MNALFMLQCLKSVQIQSFFWSVLSRFRTEYEDLQSNSPYSVRIWESRDQEKTANSETFHAVLTGPLST